MPCESASANGLTRHPVTLGRGGMPRDATGSCGSWLAASRSGWAPEFW